MVTNNSALRDRLDAIGKALDANHFDQETVDRLLAEAIAISEAQMIVEANPPEPESVRAKSQTAIQQSRALTAKALTAKLLKPEDPARLVTIMEQVRITQEQASIRADRTIDLMAWAESSTREIAELEQTMNEDQDWYIDLFRRDLSLAQKELVRRERLERPPTITGPDAGIDWADLIQRVKEKVRLVDLFEGYGVGLKKSGKSYKGCCPFHDDDTPSLVIRTIGGIDHYKCYGCQAHGDVISFVQSTRQLRFLEAVRWLAEDYFLLPVINNKGE